MGTHNYYSISLKVLANINKDFPKLPLGKHLSTAFAEYGDVFNLTDKDISIALKKYHSLLLLNSEDKEFSEEDDSSLFDEDDQLDEEDNW